MQLLRKRPNDEKLEDLVKLIKDNGKIALADISNDEEGIFAQKIGFDCVSTTLSGYTDYTPKLKGPDFGLVARMVDKLIFQFCRRKNKYTRRFKNSL